MLSIRTGISTIAQRLIFNARQMENHFSLEHYNIHENDVIYMVFRLPHGNTTITELVVPIKIDGVNSDKIYNFGTEDKYREMTYEKLRTEVAKLVNIKEEEYDFSDGEDDITNNKNKNSIIIKRNKISGYKKIL